MYKDATSISDMLLDEASICAKVSGLDVESVRELAAFARTRNRSLIEVLVDRKGVDEGELTRGLAKSLGFPFVDEMDEIPTDVLSEISPGLAIKNDIIPVGKTNGTLRVAVWDPFDWQRWDDLAHILGRPIEKALASRSVIRKMLKANYGIGADTVEHLLGGRGDEDSTISAGGSSDLSAEDAANEPTIVNLVNNILTEAIRANATDIHFEPYEDEYLVRYRIDGMLEEVSIPGDVNLLKLAIVSRIKIMSHLDITEKRLPQDGRCQVSLAGQDFDLRISILPGINGEAVMIRLQSRHMASLELASLGFGEHEESKIHELISRPHGLVLVTGPTGSGKTTTLYSCLNNIITPETKIITIEDPVEYRMGGILQMQVRDEIGFSFARALRSILRHDPDIILVGEIRDIQTAEIAIRSSLTGHLVFATLHTNDASSAATRLTDIGVEPFLVASAVQGILAQRLVRKVCTHCRQPVDASSLSDFERKLLQDAGYLETALLYKGTGCQKCRFTGYRGRMAVGEVLDASPQIRRLIQQSESPDQIKKVACQAGMRTLRESGLLAVKAGITTIQEVLRVTQEDS